VQGRTLCGSKRLVKMSCYLSDSSEIVQIFSHTTKRISVIISFGMACFRDTFSIFVRLINVNMSTKELSCSLVDVQVISLLLMYL